MQQCLPFRYPMTFNDVTRLSMRLRQAFAAVGFLRGGRLRVLNLACGRADETGALARALAPAKIAHYLGIDLRADAIEEAARRWRLPEGLIEFRSGDAAMIARMGLISDVDLIFIRHQNYWDNPVAWDRMLEGGLKVLKVLKEDGLLVCTSYFDQEHELLVAAMKTRGAEVLWNVRDPESRELAEVPGKSVDRHLAVFRKPESGDPGRIS